MCLNQVVIKNSHGVLTNLRFEVAKECTNTYIYIYNARTNPLSGLLNFLLGDVGIAVVAVISFTLSAAQD